MVGPVDLRLGLHAQVVADDPEDRAALDRLQSTTDPTGQFANEAPQVLGFTTREQLRQALAQRSGGRLQLDP